MRSLALSMLLLLLTPAYSAEAGYGPNSLEAFQINLETSIFPSAPQAREGELHYAQNLQEPAPTAVPPAAPTAAGVDPTKEPTPAKAEGFQGGTSFEVPNDSRSPQGQPNSSRAVATPATASESSGQLAGGGGAEPWPGLTDSYRYNLMMRAWQKKDK